MVYAHALWALTLSLIDPNVTRISRGRNREAPPDSYARRREASGLRLITRTRELARRHSYGGGVAKARSSRVGVTKTVCGPAFAAGGDGEMRGKKIGKRGSVIIALIAVIAALAASPVASAASWGEANAFYDAPGASWGDAS
jgi:hypothetical protein